MRFICYAVYGQMLAKQFDMAVASEADSTDHNINMLIRIIMYLNNYWKKVFNLQLFLQTYLQFAVFFVMGGSHSLLELLEGLTA